MDKSYIEISIASAIDATELAGLLNLSGMVGAWEENGRVRLYWERNEWNTRTLETIHQALRQLGDPQPKSNLTVQEIPSEDWNARWAAQVRPLWIGKRFLIRPSWESVPMGPHTIELIIDPKQAFGTGHHATTQLLMEWLEDIIRGGETVLDIGTGTGILAMAALRLGARSARGIDHDSVATQCAEEYARLNGFGPELDLCATGLEDLEPSPWDIILANLDRQTILKHRHQFSHHATVDSRLLISGILIEDHDEMTMALAPEGWGLVGKQSREEWLALEFTFQDCQPITPAGSPDTR